jgi:hypothetical protein
VIQLYRLDFSFRARPGWPPSAVLTMLIDNGFDVLKTVEHYKIQNLERIQLVNFEDKPQ